MSAIGMFIGSTTGKTEAVAELIQAEFGGESIVKIHDISDCDASDLQAYETLILGCPTWNIGDLQSDWEEFYEGDLEEVDFSGKKVAYFGTGDQFDYPDNFQDAIGILEEKVSEQGGTTVGLWPNEGYDFNESRGIRDGIWLGLAIDEDNQPELTEGRVKSWVTSLKSELGI